MTRVQLARYIDGSQLERYWADIEETDYIAISHVWAEAKWQNVKGIPEEILVSDHKARFLEEELPVLVGSSSFWMDVLCADQIDAMARKALLGSIPDIFKLAARTIAIRDGDRMGQCCSDAKGNFNDWPEGAARRLSDHFWKDHASMDSSKPTSIDCGRYKKSSFLTQCSS